jgi:hypothetical protein
VDVGLQRRQSVLVLSTQTQGFDGKQQEMTGLQSSPLGVDWLKMARDSKRRLMQIALVSSSNCIGELFKSSVKKQEPCLAVGGHQQQLDSGLLALFPLLKIHPHLPPKSVGQAGPIWPACSLCSWPAGHPSPHPTELVFR